MDTRSKEKRSLIMSAVHSKNTSPELLVRRFLWSHGIRYRIHPKYLPGKPDIAIPRYKLAIFVHGCFWHGHGDCHRGRLPKSRKKYWKAKIEANKKRDALVEEELEAIGWNQLIIWDCQLRTQKAATRALPKLLESMLLLCPGLTIKDIS
jgi:DNA mismatch endonuclease (patch repair protein)